MRPTLRAPNLNKGRYNANATTRCAGLRTFHVHEMQNVLVEACG
jgi:hypothetical protein